MKTLIGLVAFGNLEFTKLAIRGLRETITRPYDLFVIVGKPGDEATQNWLCEQDIHWLGHEVNLGFPASLNDIMDRAFVHDDYDALILMGNDVIPYPGAITAMIDAAETTDYAWIAASEFNSKALVAMYPEAQQFFTGPNLVFSDFTARPWELHKDTSPPPSFEPGQLKDVRNLCLFKRSVLEKLGYADVNFWPGGYFEDNDYARRGVNAGIKACGLRHAQFFHFWSRTIHQQGGSTTGTHFGRNRDYYRHKWGGDFDHETWQVPFDGQGSLKIADRREEPGIIQHWSTLK